MEDDQLLSKHVEFDQINELYDECLDYLKKCNGFTKHDELRPISTVSDTDFIESDYETIKNNSVNHNKNLDDLDNPRDAECGRLIEGNHFDEVELGFKIENEMVATDSNNSLDLRSERLRKLSRQLPKIIITQSNTSLELKQGKRKIEDVVWKMNDKKKPPVNKNNNIRKPSMVRRGYGDFPKRLVSKTGLENVAVISNVPFEKIRLLNDTFHTLINLRWRWIVMGTIVVHFAIWLVFAVFWYITALAHYDFEPNPPNKTCVTGGKDFVTIFLASVEAQTTIGFGDRAIDEECPESIFLFIMQFLLLEIPNKIKDYSHSKKSAKCESDSPMKGSVELILGTGLSGVLTCVVYAKLTRPEKLSRDGVGFSKKAVICLRDGRLCLMMRAWDLNYDHIISSEFSAHFVNTHRTKEGEVIRYFARSLALQHRQFLLWPVTLVHVIDEDSPLYDFTPEQVYSHSYEITVSLKGASASMGTFTQSQTSYLPREVIWGHRFPPVVKFDPRKQKYVIDHKKLDAVEPVETPYCSASQMNSIAEEKPETLKCPGTPSSFSEKITAFQLERSSSFKKRHLKQ